MLTDEQLRKHKGQVGYPENCFLPWIGDVPTPDAIRQLEENARQLEGKIRQLEQRIRQLSDIVFVST